jgi:hypothetical protein
MLAVMLDSLLILRDMFACIATSVRELVLTYRLAELCRLYLAESEPESCAAGR